MSTKNEKIFSEQELEDFNWLLDHYQEWVKQYPEKWVAVYQKTLAAVGKNAEEVSKKAREKYGLGCTPVVMFVEGGAYVY